MYNIGHSHLAQQLDPAQGEWCVDTKKLDIWLDMSSLAVGVVLNTKG